MTTLVPRAFFRYPFGPGLAVTALLAIPFPRRAVFVGTLTSVVIAGVRYGRQSAAGRRAGPTVVGGVAGSG